MCLFISPEVFIIIGQNGHSLRPGPKWIGKICKMVWKKKSFIFSWSPKWCKNIYNWIWFVFMWILMWDFVFAEYSQRWQENGFSPEWTKMWALPSILFMTLLQYGQFHCLAPNFMLDVCKCQKENWNQLKSH